MREEFKKSTKINLFKSLSAYGIPNHRHNAEISQELSYYQIRINLILLLIFYLCLEEFYLQYMLKKRSQ